MAQPLDPIVTKLLPKPDKIKVNIASNEGKNIKMYIKLKWTVYELKEHLYAYDYFPHAAFNQVISLHGTDLENAQTFEEIYDAIQNKGSKSILRSLRGQLTWEPDDAHKAEIEKLTQQNDDNDDSDDDSKQSLLSNTQSIAEISLYIRAKRAPKSKLGTLTSDEPVIQEFIASRHRESVVTVKSPTSDASSTDSSSSSSRVGGYRATTFNPEALRKKQERKALKKLQKSQSPLQSPLQSPQIRFVHSPHMEPVPQHAATGSVVFHHLELLNKDSDDAVPSDTSSEPSSQSNSNPRSITPVAMDPDHTNDSSSSAVSHDKEEKEEKQSTSESPKRIKKKHSHRLSLYADISGKILSAQVPRDSDDIDSDNEAEQTPLTQENLYMHTTGQPATHGRRGSKISSSGGSMDWGGGPFIVRRMSIGSSSGLPSNLEFYHAANASSHLWELDTPDYYEDMPDSLQRIHTKLEMKGTKQHSSFIEPVDEHHVLEEKEKEKEAHHDELQSRKSVTFSAHVVYKSEEEEDSKAEEKVDVENVSKWKIKQIGVDDRYVAMNNKIEIQVAAAADDDDDDSTDSISRSSNDSDNNQIQFNMNASQSDSDETESSSVGRESNGIYDEVVVKRDKLQQELTWKTSYLGIWLIGSVWFGAFHCLYSFSAIVNNVVSTLNVKLFEFGLMYSVNFIGVGIGLFISSYLLNKPQWMNSSHTVAKHSICIVFICQCIATAIFLYEYAIDSDTSPDAILWFILVLSRGIMGVAIGFVESSVNNLVFEWFSNDAFNAKLSASAHEADKEYLAKLSTRVLSYCMFLKEFGHISARLCLVPMIYLTFSDNSNLFVPLLFGVVISGLGWCQMMYVSYRDNKYSSSYHQIEKDDLPSSSPTGAPLHDEPASDDDSESTPLLPPLTDKPIANSTHQRSTISHRTIPEDWSYRDWYSMGLIGLNRSVVLSIIFLSITFGVSFSFTILSITNLCQQYQYTDYTANLLICCIPIATLFGSPWLRAHVLSKINSIWTVMFMGAVLYIVLFAAFAFTGISGTTSTWLPIFCVILFIFASECALASGYELLSSSAPEYIYGLISGLNSTTNFVVSGLCILIFSVLVMDYSANELNVVNQYRWAYAFCCFISVINLICAIALRYSFGANVRALQNIQSQ